MRVVMMGTGAFAVPTFEALGPAGHTIAALVTQPAREASGRKKPPIGPMRAKAAELGVPVVEFEDVNTPDSIAALAALRADLLVVADYGQILSPQALEASRLGGINLHGSLLPKYRGAAPVNWAIYHGERETGVSVIHMTPRLDAGPVLAQASTPIDPDENAVELEHRLSKLGAPLVTKTIEDLAAGRTQPIPQDPQLASKARRLRKSDGVIDWKRSAEAIKNQVRAFEPWPRTYTFWHHAGAEPMRLVPGRVAVVPTPDPESPGTVLEAPRGQLVVACGTNALEIQQVQPAGGRMLSADEFLRGHPVPAGDVFSPQAES